LNTKKGETAPLKKERERERKEKKRRDNANTLF
jgi:hypothetical protein